jgi:hypothetical protein
VHELLAGTEPLLLSAPVHYGDLRPDSIRSGHAYIMLHGSDRDGSRFWGNSERSSAVVEAINTGAMPQEGLGIILAGCCWGALTVFQRAKEGSAALARKLPEQSMALTALQAGALAFVGCTGVHYSPSESGDFFGGPMHAAFWRQIAAGDLPARALFDARVRFLQEMPHGRSIPLELAIERKIYKEFTCLGLGY